MSHPQAQGQPEWPPRPSWPSGFNKKNLLLAFPLGLLQTIGQITLVQTFATSSNAGLGELFVSIVLATYAFVGNLFLVFVLTFVTKTFSRTFVVGLVLNFFFIVGQTLFYG